MCPGHFGRFEHSLWPDDDISEIEFYVGVGAKEGSIKLTRSGVEAMMANHEASRGRSHQLRPAS